MLGLRTEPGMPNTKRADLVLLVQDSALLHLTHDRARLRRLQDVKHHRTLAAYQMHHQLDSHGVDALTTSLSLGRIVDTSPKPSLADSVEMLLEQGYTRSQLRLRGTQE
jgi:hypothetical protein